MATASKTFTLTVNSSGGNGQVPVSGQMLLVGTNTQYSLVTDPAYSARFTSTADGSPISQYLFGYAINNAYGGGCYVPGFGTNGSFIAANLSGDTAPRIWDAVVFDFSTYAWTLRVNSYGIKNQQLADHDAANGTESWAQQWTTDGKEEIPSRPGVPHPTQSYRMFVGVGDKYVMCGAAYSGAGGTGGSGWSHQYDPNTRTYSLLSTNALDSLSGTYSTWKTEAVALYDPNDGTANGRIWFIVKEVGGQPFTHYLDLNDNTWKKATHPGGPTTGNDGNWHHALYHYDGTRRCILRFHADDAAGHYPIVLDLNNVSAGWQNCTLSGSLADFYRRSYIQAFGVRWAQYPSADGGDNCHYTTDGYSKRITKITPPPSGVTGTWTVSSITPSNFARQSGTSYTLAFPDAEQGTGGSGAGSPSQWLPHMTRFFYVPALKCFAWVAGGFGPVALWKP